VLDTVAQADIIPDAPCALYLIAYGHAITTLGADHQSAAPAPALGAVGPRRGPRQAPGRCHGGPGASARTRPSWRPLPLRPPRMIKGDAGWQAAGKRSRKMFAVRPGKPPTWRA